MDIVARAKAITLNPAATWPVIEAESHDAKSLYVPYLLILAAIPAVCSFIGMSIIGIGFGLRLPIGSGLAMMVTTYIMSLVMTFGMGWLISALAPTFGGQSNLIQGLKIAVFGATPMMLAGALAMAVMVGITMISRTLKTLMPNNSRRSVPGASPRRKSSNSNLLLLVRLVRSSISCIEFFMRCLLSLSCVVGVEFRS